jgi:hypothetical protein
MVTCHSGTVTAIPASIRAAVRAAAAIPSVLAFCEAVVRRRSAQKVAAIVPRPGSQRTIHPTRCSMSGVLRLTDVGRLVIQPTGSTAEPQPHHPSMPFRETRLWNDPPKLA